MVILELFIDLFLLAALGPKVESASKINEFQEYFLWGKGGLLIGLTTLPPPCVDCDEILEPRSPGTLRASRGIALPFSPLVKLCHRRRRRTRTRRRTRRMEEEEEEKVKKKKKKKKKNAFLLSRMRANFDSNLILLVLIPLITPGVQVMELPVKYNFLLPLLTFPPWRQKFPPATSSHP